MVYNENIKKKAIYKWNETHREQHLKQNNKNVKAYYIKNREAIKMEKRKISFRKRFFNLFLIYTKLYDDKEIK